MTVTYDKPILTVSEVREWQTRSVELTASIRSMTSELALLGQKLEAAKIIMGELPSIDAPAKGTTAEAAHAEQGEEEAAQDDSLPGAALAAVAALGNLPKPDAIKKWIAGSSPALAERLKVSPNYFYTVLIRHVQKGRLIREAGGGYRLPNASPQGDTGGVAHPRLGL